MRNLARYLDSLCFWMVCSCFVDELFQFLTFHYRLSTPQKFSFYCKSGNFSNASSHSHTRKFSCVAFLKTLNCRWCCTFLGDRLIVSAIAPHLKSYVIWLPLSINPFKYKGISQQQVNSMFNSGLKGAVEQTSHA